MYGNNIRTRITVVLFLIHFTFSREMDEISSFIKGAICDEQCLGRCLYIHGVPGTGKVKFF